MAAALVDHPLGTSRVRGGSAFGDLDLWGRPCPARSTRIAGRAGQGRPYNLAGTLANRVCCASALSKEFTDYEPQMNK